MKIILKSIVVISFFITSQLAFAGSFVDSATVTSVEKVYKQYRVDEPYQDCYIKETLQTGDGSGSATNEIMGAILGGAIGNQFGEGDGKDIMTLAGIFLGASIANDAEKANSTGQVVVSQEVCENKVRQKIVKRLSHYKINVDYNGHNVSYTSNRRPYDDVVKVKVTISSLND
ncbi:MAG: hypothetical protein AAEF61_07710 [Candidatus Pseudothioglobus sp.]